MADYYPYDPEQMGRAEALAEILKDCVMLYLQEIAADEPTEVQAEAIETLAAKLQAGCCR